MSEIYKSTISDMKQMWMANSLRKLQLVWKKEVRELTSLPVFWKFYSHYSHSVNENFKNSSLQE